MNHFRYNMSTGRLPDQLENVEINQLGPLDSSVLWDQEKHRSSDIEGSQVVKFRSYKCRVDQLQRDAQQIIQYVGLWG